MSLHPLPAAAAQLGITPEALRKRLLRGTVGGRKRRGQWFVDLELGDLDGLNGRPDMASGLGGQTSGGASTDQEPPAAGQRQDAAAGQPGGVGEALQLQRAEEMAAVYAALLEPWRRRVEELAAENGALRTRLELATVDTANGIHQTPSGAAQSQGWPERRRWYHRLIWG